MYPHLLVRGRWFFGATPSTVIASEESNLRPAGDCFGVLRTPRNEALDRQKKPGLAPGLRVVAADRADQKSMPPPPGIAGAGACFFGTSATIASVVIRRPATE